MLCAYVLRCHVNPINVYSYYTSIKNKPYPGHPASAAYVAEDTQATFASMEGAASTSDGEMSKTEKRSRGIMRCDYTGCEGQADVNGEAQICAATEGHVRVCGPTAEGSVLMPSSHVTTKVCADVCRLCCCRDQADVGSLCCHQSPR